MTLIDQLESFAQAHPALMSSPIAWALATAIVTAIFRHRTEEELAKLPAPLAMVLRVCSAAGVDSAAVLGLMKAKAPPAPTTAPDAAPPSEEVKP